MRRILDLPLVCTNDVHYLRQADHRPHDVLLCIGTGKNVQDEHRLRYHGDQFYLKTPAEMAQVFADYPQALRNTVAIAERCDVDLGDTGNHLPGFDVPPGFTVDTYFEHVVREGFKARLPRLRELAAASKLHQPLEAYEEKLAYEIDVIKRMRYPGYFLIVWDFIRYARDHGIPVGPGRGFSGRQPGGLLPAHHGCRPAGVRPDLRTLPQSRTRNRCPTSTSTSASAAAAK